MPKLRTTGKNSERPNIVRGSGNVFRDLGFPEEEAAHLLVRADLMIEVLKAIDAGGLSPSQAAASLGVAQSRISELRSGKMEKFSVDLLLQYLARLGKRVEFAVKDDVA